MTVTKLAVLLAGLMITALALLEMITSARVIAP